MNDNKCNECDGTVVIYNNELVCGTCGLVHRPVYDVDIPQRFGTPIYNKKLYPKHNVIDNTILTIIADGNLTRRDIVKNVSSRIDASKTQIYRRIAYLEAKGIITNVGYILTIEKKER